MNPLTESYIRTALKIVGAMLATKGYTDNAGAEALIGLGMALVGALWSHFHHVDKS